MPLIKEKEAQLSWRNQPGRSFFNDQKGSTFSDHWLLFWFYCQVGNPKPSL